MKLLGPKSFPELREIFDMENSFKDKKCGDGKDTWARGRFEDANKQLGKWCEVELSHADILEVKLIWNSEHLGNEELIPPEGLTVLEALQRPAVRTWLRKGEIFPETHLWLVTETLKETSAIEYGKLTNHHGRLITLDGLHRLLAWGEGGKTRTLAFVAGL